jgi:hypothetical protein
MAAKFTEERIENISKKIVAKLAEEDMIRSSANYRKALVAHVGRILFEDQKIEMEIEQEAIKVLEPFAKKVAQGTPQWEAMYIQAKERLAKKHNFEL